MAWRISYEVDGETKALLDAMAAAKSVTTAQLLGGLVRNVTVQVRRQQMLATAESELALVPPPVVTLEEVS
jgi:hypothetical protein